MGLSRSLTATVASVPSWKSRSLVAIVANGWTWSAARLYSTATTRKIPDIVGTAPHYSRHLILYTAVPVESWPSNHQTVSPLLKALAKLDHLGVTIAEDPAAVGVSWSSLEGADPTLEEYFWLAFTQRSRCLMSSFYRIGAILAIYTPTLFPYHPCHSHL